jgi:hypothetical protein
VFLEFGRPGVVFGQPPVVTYRLIDILNRTSLQKLGQVMTCLESLDNAVARLRGNANIRFCGFDNEGYCFIAPETQAAIVVKPNPISACRAQPGSGSVTDRRMCERKGRSSQRSTACELISRGKWRRA